MYPWNGEPTSYQGYKHSTVRFEGNRIGGGYTPKIDPIEGMPVKSTKGVNQRFEALGQGVRESSIEFPTAITRE